MDFLASLIASILIKYIDQAPSNRDLALELWSISLVLCTAILMLSGTWFVAKLLIFHPLPTQQIQQGK